MGCGLCGVRVACDCPNEESGGVSQVLQTTTSDGLAGSESKEDLLVFSDTTLGEGATATVMLGHFGHEREEVAIKVVSKPEMDEDDLLQIREEIRLHKMLSHEHIVRMIDSWEKPFEFTIVLALCRGGSLFETIVAAYQAETDLPEPKVRVAFVQLAAALDYLHDRGIYHLDVNLRNLCWTDESESAVQLIDFGYATDAKMKNCFAGTAQFAAPEVHEASQGESSFECAPADVWSAGVCLFTMLAMQVPFSGTDENEEQAYELQQKVCVGQWDVQPSCSPSALDLLRGMLYMDAEERMTIKQVCNHYCISAMKPMPLKQAAQEPSQHLSRGAGRSIRRRDAENEDIEACVGRMSY